MMMKTQQAPVSIKLCWIFGFFLILAGSVLSPSRADEVRSQGIVSERHRDLEERVKELERKMDLLEDGVKHSGTAISKKESLSEQLVEGEMGGVEGVIRWKGKPLVHSDVMVVLMRYTGISLASLKKTYSGSGDKDRGIFFETTTDALGRYRFEKMPPGEYIFYWKPDAETGWVRRMNDKSDVEVLPGKMMVLNIPAERK
ncbi:hypothetical protein [Candidatus Deferrimicrobium sp.]|uniref:hypothetical protein n=1 Tax=Candidatus Deferrimicrobium sp. TaxID=3060586 RepID=UPI00271F6A14|nr:hypothetical protein [Candidatus Deferrimicrobium sp.]MDO8739080.1 hypothetical protein [Candidatus Deferrimicrobium sp.]